MEGGADLLRALLLWGAGRKPVNSAHLFLCHALASAVTFRVHTEHIL